MPRTHALDLTKDTVKNGYGQATTVVQKPYLLDDTAQLVVDRSDGVIRDAHQLVPHGASNQKADVKANPLAKNLTHATQIAYSVKPFMDGKGPLAPFPSTKPQYVAGATMTFGSGNCQDMAAVVYLLLRERFDNNYIVDYGCSPANKHSFCLIWPKNQKDAEHTVVVDAWPKYAQALLWKHHFCFQSQYVSYVQKPGSGLQGKVAKARAKYSNLAFVVHVLSQVVNTQYGSSPYNLKFASYDEAIYAYHPPMS